MTEELAGLAYELIAVMSSAFGPPLGGGVFVSGAEQHGFELAR